MLWPRLGTGAHLKQTNKVFFFLISDLLIKMRSLFFESGLQLPGSSFIYFITQQVCKKLSRHNLESSRSFAILGVALTIKRSARYALAQEEG